MSLCVCSPIGKQNVLIAPKVTIFFFHETKIVYRACNTYAV